MSSVLDAQGLRKSYGARELLPGVDFSVAEREKVGVVGRNGSGKSTLLRILAGEESADAGTVALRRGLRVAYLPQDPPVDPHRTIFRTAGEGTGSLQGDLLAYQEVNQELARGPDGARLEELLARQSRLASRIERDGGWDLQHRIETVLTRLGIEGWERTMGTLSGGERRRVALARTLLSEPELLLLDEPTNHLDADTVLWLEETLYDFPGAVVVVTHDRYFLDRVVDRMVEVSHRGLTSYPGGYTDYLAQRAEREAREAVEAEKRSRLLEKELAWARRSPPARTGKQKARRARAAEMAEEARESSRERQGTVELEVTEAPRLGRTVLELHDVGKDYGERTVLDGVSDRLSAGERIGVVGPNGAGKSTLLRIVVGEETPDRGHVVLGENTRVGYLDQQRELDPELTIARAVSVSDWVELNGRRLHLKAYLDRFLFPAHLHNQKVSSLSGGERTRLLLARLLLERFNLLVLDEPTNDLDLDTLRILEEAVEDFPGCVLVVTHDRFLLDKVATSLLVFEGEGRVRRHHGSWDRWLQRREAETAARRERERDEERARKEARASAAREQAREARSDRPRLSYRERQELDGVVERIRILEGEKEKLETQLADPATYGGDTTGIAVASRRLGEVQGELEPLYERWMELEERAG
ncbi:MAG: ABC transporter ATP-binding protein [Gemmatimonadales bacterium]|nr:MAG: ABC transporter ATP-binding protein [Gemmatimonadales bacterium]